MIHFSGMKKTVLMVLLGGVILGSIGAGAYIFFQKKTSPAVTPVSDASGSAQISAPTLRTWNDPAGFTMQYPEGLDVNKHDEDTVHYAHVELTDRAHPGRIVVWASDLPKGVTTTASWGKLMATPSSAISFDTTLGGKPAQKILVSGPEKSVTTGVVYDGIVWSVEAALGDGPYWQSVYDAIVQSFSFVSVPAQNAPASAGVPQDAVDEEEVLQ